jgi:DNA-binding transcriptional MerR regulator
MKKKRQKKARNEWAALQAQHGLSDEDIQLARQTGFPLKRFQELLGSDRSDSEASPAERIRDIFHQWQEKVAKRRADIEAGLIEPKKKKPAKDLQPDLKWAEAKQVCRLNMDDIRKAKELGLTPQTLIRNVPSPSQKWKAPVKEWIDELYGRLLSGRLSK